MKRKKHKTSNRGRCSRRGRTSASCVSRTSKPWRRAEKITKRFWGIKRIPRLIHVDFPGIPKNAPFAGLGTSRKITIADAPKGQHTKVRTLKIKGRLLGDPTRKRLLIFRRSKRMKTSRPKLIGYVKTTFYHPPPDIEKEGSFKSGTEYHHSHEDDNGIWPPLYKDVAGNFIYGPATYTYADEWIRR